MADQLPGTEGDAAAVAVDADVLVVSNREPYRHEFDGDGGDVVVDRPTGGLTAGLDPVMCRVGGTWVAWGDGEADFAVSDDRNRVEVPPEDPAYTLQRVPLSSAEVAGYYEGYANQTLWPLCHTLTGRVRFDEADWSYYRAVNERFAEVVAAEADDDSTVWFQDYHFGLAPRFLRERSEALLAQFWHVPWPAADVFRVAPHAEALLDGLLANDLLGFHVPRYGANFLRTVDELLADAVVDWDAASVHYRGRETHVESFPLGVDAERIRRLADEAAASGGADSGRHPEAVASADGGTVPGVASFRRTHGISPEQPLVLGVDRLDYTKGIPERLDALEHLWEARADLRGAFTYVQKGERTREGIDAYRELQSAVEERIERLEDRFGTDEWRPVVYATEHLPEPQLYDLYRDASVALVTPLRDGMNLVAKEFVAAQMDDDPGALVLSRFAGAAHELGDGALLVNPNDTAETAAAILEGLEMDGEERRRRTRLLREQVDDGGVRRWIDEVLDALADIDGAHGGRRA